MKKNPIKISAHGLHSNFLRRPMISGSTDCPEFLSFVGFTISLLNSRISDHFHLMYSDTNYVCLNVVPICLRSQVIPILSTVWSSLNVRFLLRVICLTFVHVVTFYSIAVKNAIIVRFFHHRTILILILCVLVLLASVRYILYRGLRPFDC